MTVTACGSSKKSGETTGTTQAGGTTAPAGPTTTVAPKDGGDITMGVEAEIDGFDPTKNRFDVTGLTYAQTVYDPLMQFGDDGKVHPYLAESMTPNADFTQWTIKLRSGLKFHDGSPVTADDVVTVLQAHQKSALTGFAISNIDTISKVDDLSTLVKMKGPWVPFPSYLTGQLGYIPKASTITGDTAQNKPIGTGPFVFKEWVPNDHFTATKNANYWQKGLPHLNSVTYKPIVEAKSREDALKAGQIQIFHTTETHTIKKFQSDKSVQMILQTKGELEEDLIMLNTAAEPFNNAHARKALALATNVELLKKVQADDIPPVVDSPFSQGSAFAADGDIGYPKFNLDEAKKEVAAYKTDTGKDLTFRFGTTNSGRNLEINQFIVGMWKDAGINAQIDQVQQSQYINLALVGQYQAYSWRQFGEPDPDADFVWWGSGTAADVGKIALNFSRNKDPQIDADLKKGRESQDPAERKAAYQDIAKQFAKDLPFIWTTQATWAIVANPNVANITSYTLPDGSAGAGLLSGRFQMAYVSLQ